MESSLVPGGTAENQIMKSERNLLVMNDMGCDRNHLNHSKYRYKLAITRWSKLVGNGLRLIKMQLTGKNWFYTMNKPKDGNDTRCVCWGGGEGGVQHKI